MSTRKVRKLFFYLIYTFSIVVLLKMAVDLTRKTSCIFCNIANRLDDTDILYEDEDVCVFRDIHPATNYHVLVIPRRHIEDVKALIPSDKDLVTKMYEIGKQMLSNNSLLLSNARLGFHWPPFRSVKHLHLHVMAPESEMSRLSRLIFMKNSYWFVSPEYVINML